MLKIKFYPETMTIKFKGHAGYDEYGKDIVCASASTLFYTLSESLLKCGHMFKKGSLKIKEDGRVTSISCKPLKRYEANVQLMYWTVLNGLWLLAWSYPQNATLEICEARNSDEE